MAAKNKPKAISVLLVEDDISIAGFVKDYLREVYPGINITEVQDGAVALRLGLENQYDLFMFDVVLPTMYGHEVLKLLRESGKMTPAVGLSATRYVDDFNALPNS